MTTMIDILSLDCLNEIGTYLTLRDCQALNVAHRFFHWCQFKIYEEVYYPIKVPTNCTILKLKIRQFIDKLPETLTSLHFGCQFNQKWDLPLPLSLISLNFGAE